MPFFARRKFARQEGFAFPAGKATAVATCHRYIAKSRLSNPENPKGEIGTPGGIRTPGLLLRRQLLYPTELLAHRSFPTGYGLSAVSSEVLGAGDGNRTHVFSLEG